MRSHAAWIAGSPASPWMSLGAARAANHGSVRGHSTMFTEGRQLKIIEPFGGVDFEELVCYSQLLILLLIAALYLAYNWRAIPRLFRKAPMVEREGERCPECDTLLVGGGDRLTCPNCGTMVARGHGKLSRP